MRTSSSDVFQWIPRDQIDAEDRRFALFPAWLPVDALVRSIRECGVLSPLQVEKKPGGKFRPVMGFRRLSAAAELMLVRLPCMIRPEGDPLRVVVEVLEENLSTRNLSLVEKGHALRVLKHNFQVEDETLLDRFMPMLGIRPDGYHLHRYLELAALPQSLQERLLDDLEADVALPMARWKDDERQLLLELISKFRLGRNRQKQLFALLDELRAIKPEGADSVTAIWRENCPLDVQEDESRPPSEIFLRCFGRLQRLRFPRLSEYEQEYERLRSVLRLPPQLQIQAPPNFEGDRLKVCFSFQDPDELRSLALRLEELSRTEELKAILKLL